MSEPAERLARYLQEHLSTELCAHCVGSGETHEPVRGLRGLEGARGVRCSHCGGLGLLCQELEIDTSKPEGQQIVALLREFHGWAHVVLPEGTYLAGIEHLAPTDMLFGVGVGRIAVTLVRAASAEEKH